MMEAWEGIMASYEEDKRAYEGLFIWDCFVCSLIYPLIYHFIRPFICTVIFI